MARTRLAMVSKLPQASGRRRHWRASSPPRSCSARMRLARRRRSSSASTRDSCGGANDDEIEPQHNDITALDPSPQQHASPSGQPGGIVGPRANATSSSDNRVAAAAASKATNTSCGTSVYDGRLRQRRWVERMDAEGLTLANTAWGGAKVSGRESGSAALEMTVETPPKAPGGSQTCFSRH